MSYIFDLSHAEILSFSIKWTDHEFILLCLVGCLQSLNAKTGIFSKRMKIIHKDPLLHAQRVAAIKVCFKLNDELRLLNIKSSILVAHSLPTCSLKQRTKGTTAARNRASEGMRSYFSDPENRLKRSISMKGLFDFDILFPFHFFSFLLVLCNV